MQGIPTIGSGDVWEPDWKQYSYVNNGAGLPALGGRGWACQDIKNKQSGVRLPGLDAMGCLCRDWVSAMRKEGIGYLQNGWYSRV